MLLASRWSCCFDPSLRFHGPQHFIHFHAPVFVGEPRVVEVGFKVVGDVACRVHETAAVPPDGPQEGVRIPAVLGACLLVGRVKRPEVAVRPEIGAVPEIHQSENAMLNPAHPGRGVAIQEPELLEPLENPLWEIDLDAVRIEDLPVEIV